MIQFYRNSPEFEGGITQRLICLTQNFGEIADECYDGYKYWYGWFIIIGSILPVFSFGALVLSCNDGNCRKWGAIIGICCCRSIERKKRGTSVNVLHVEDTLSTESSPLNAEDGEYGSTQPQMIELRHSLMESEPNDIELSVSKKKRTTQT